MPDVFTSNDTNHNKPHVPKSHISKSHHSVSTQYPKSSSDLDSERQHKLSLLKKEREEELKDIHPSEDVHKLPGHSHNPLASFCYYPDHVKFVNADNQERVIVMVRKHPITNVSWIAIAFIMFIAPSFLTLIPFVERLPGDFQVILNIVWYLITFAFILESFLEWYFNVCLITDERIIDVDFVNLLYREISEANIKQVQDVTVEVGGGLMTLFGFGNVLIQTAAEKEKLELASVPNPDRIAKILRELELEEQIEEMEGRVR